MLAGIEASLHMEVLPSRHRLSITYPVYSKMPVQQSPGRRPVLFDSPLYKPSHSHSHSHSISLHLFQPADIYEMDTISSSTITGNKTEIHSSSSIVSFRNLSYHVKEKTKGTNRFSTTTQTKLLVEDVSLDVKSGELLAIMVRLLLPQCN